MAPWAGNHRGQFAGSGEVWQRHRSLFPGRNIAAVSGPVFEGWRAKSGCGASDRVRDGNKQMVALVELARWMHKGLGTESYHSISGSEPKTRLRYIEGRPNLVRGVCVGSGQAGALR